MPGIELITLRWSGYRISLSYIRFLISSHRFTATVLVFIRSDYRPVIYPVHRIQVNHTSVSSLILKMNKPRLTRISIYPTALMRTVYIRLPLYHYNFRLIRSIDVLRAKHQLPTVSHTTCRSKNIIVSVPFIEFRTFYRMILSVVTIEYHYRIRNDFRSFFIQF